MSDGRNAEIGLAGVPPALPTDPATGHLRRRGSVQGQDILRRNIESILANRGHSSEAGSAAASAERTQPEAFTTKIQLLEAPRFDLQKSHKLTCATSQLCSGALDVIVVHFQHIQRLREKRCKVHVRAADRNSAALTALPPEFARLGCFNRANCQCQVHPQSPQCLPPIRFCTTTFACFSTDPRRQVFDDHRGFNLVAVLTTRPATPPTADFTLCEERLFRQSSWVQIGHEIRWKVVPSGAAVNQAQSTRPSEPGPVNTAQ